MKPTEMNLASRPFANEQPVIRSSVLLWILGLALLVLNITLYYRHIEGKGELQELLRQTDERLIEETDAIEHLRGELGQLDLVRQNERVTFLNSHIALRIFSWSALFDRLAEVVPAAIQMKGISPNIVGAKDADPRGRLGDSSDEMVKVDLQGTTRSPEAVLELVDALFAHPSFFDPDLTRESFAAGQDNSLPRVRCRWRMANDLGAESLAGATQDLASGSDPGRAESGGSLHLPLSTRRSGPDSGREGRAKTGSGGRARGGAPRSRRNGD